VAHRRVDRARVNADIDARVDRLDGLRRIGIDEISYKRGHRYLIVVVDHDTGRVGVGRPGCSSTSLAPSAPPT
jgi:transposase